jgi:hypothetical protein
MGLSSPGATLPTGSRNWRSPWRGPRESRRHRRDAEIEVEIDESWIELRSCFGTLLLDDGASKSPVGAARDMAPIIQSQRLSDGPVAILIAVSLTIFFLGCSIHTPPPINPPHPARTETGCVRLARCWIVGGWFGSGG